ncbi:MAG TPA: protein kinase [Bryobacteraceae bacterium]|nr:protein kinase [Bryobacteraceae bacterium]
MRSYERFEVLKELGVGAFGKTLLVEDRQKKNRKVVIKVPHDRDREEVLIRELINNAALRLSLKGMSHDNIVQLIDFARFGDYISMILEYVEGVDLRRRVGPALVDRPPLPLSEALAYFGQMCEGMSAAHDADLVHRDIKPENVLIRKKDRVIKLADFGISKISQLMTMSETQPSSIAGTPHYMAPEAWRGQASRLSDLWSLAVVLYEMLTGRLPFKADSMAALQFQIEQVRPVPPSKLNPKIEAPLQAAILRALDIDSKKRFQTAQELKAAVLGEAEKKRKISPDAGKIQAEIDSALKFVEEGKEAEAVKQLLALESREPGSAPVYLALAQIYSRSDRFLKADEVLRRGIEQCPNHAGLHLSRGMALSKLGAKSLAAAITAVERAIELGLEPKQQVSAKLLLNRWRSRAE